ncbi:hypothetical protein HDU91_001065, partial [Kappamyces sp. JEL0680]
AGKLMTMREYRENATVLENGAFCHSIHWILQGSCSVVQKVPFIKTTSGKQQYLPYRSSAEEPVEKGVVVDLDLVTQRIHPGDFFPFIPRPLVHKELSSVVDPEFMNLDTYSKFYASLTPYHPATKVQFEIQAATPCIVVSILYTQLIAILSKEMLFKMIVEPSISTHSAEALQDQFLQQRAWETFKKESCMRN